MKKIIITLLCFISALILIICYTFYHNLKKEDFSVMETTANEIQEEQNDIPNSDMDRLSEKLGTGINLGNDLDVCDWTYFGSNRSAGFQTAIIYNSYPWTAWDASDYYYFNNDGELTITWNLSDLKSDPNTNADCFAVQLVNHNKVYEGKSVRCTVNRALLTYPNGIEQDIYAVGDSFDLTIHDDVTEYFLFDLNNLGLKTSNILGGTLSVSLTISDYYLDIESNIINLEQSWGNPAANKKMIDSIKNEGFSTIRVPVTYFNHISKDGTIDAEFLDRVEEVVDWIINNDMYCIVDVHHDSGNDGWIMASDNNYSKNKKIVSYIFEQIANRFKDKDNHLILEGLNEVVNDSTQWNNIPEQDLQVMNKWNQLFVDTVRSTGGGNADRYLLVNTYAALSLEECLNAFVLPEDSVENRIFVGIHCYFNKDQLSSNFERIEKYISKYHFIIGEWSFSVTNPDSDETVKQYMSYARKLNIPAIWWDNGNRNETALFNRETNDVLYPNITNMLTGK